MTVTSYPDLLGVVFSKVEKTDDTIDFYVGDEEVPMYRLMHFQDCCESVYVEDVNGDLDDLVGSPITLAEISYNKDNQKDEYDNSATWTFIRLGTAKGVVVIWFYGTSNGYYGEEADFAIYDHKSYGSYRPIFGKEITK